MLFGPLEGWPRVEGCGPATKALLGGPEDAGLVA